MSDGQLFIVVLIAAGLGYALGMIVGFLRGASINITVRGDQVSVLTRPEAKP